MPSHFVATVSSEATNTVHQILHYRWFAKIEWFCCKKIKYWISSLWYGMNLTFWMEEIVMFCHGLGATGWVSTLGAAEVSLVMVGGSHAAAAFMTSLPQRVIDCLNTSFETTPPIRCKSIFRSVFNCFIHYFTWVTQKKTRKNSFDATAKKKLGPGDFEKPPNFWLNKFGETF